LFDLGYAVSTFEAAIEYIMSNEDFLGENSERVFKVLNAVELGDYDTTNSIVFGSSPRTPLERGQEPLLLLNHAGDNLVCIAFKNKLFDLGFSLFDAGFNMSHCNFDGDRPIHIAVRENQPEVIKRLFQLGFCATERNGAGYTPLHIAIMHDYIPIIGLILTRHRSDYRIICTIYELFVLIRSKAALDCLMNNFLLEEPIDNIKMQVNLALFSQSPDILLGFMKEYPKWLDIHVRDCEGKTLLHQIIRPGCEEYTHEIIGCLSREDKEVLFHTSDFNGDFPLFLSLKQNQIETAKSLIMHSVRLNFRNDRGESFCSEIQNETLVDQIFEFYVQTDCTEKPFIVIVNGTKNGTNFQIRTCFKNSEPYAVTRNLQDFLFIREKVFMFYPAARAIS
jgi:ankyrin repeat protein